MTAKPLQSEVLAKEMIDELWREWDINKFIWRVSDGSMHFGRRNYTNRAKLINAVIRELEKKLAL